MLHSCEVITDKVTGDSLSYAFIEFERVSVHYKSYTLLAITLPEVHICTIKHSVKETVITLLFVNVFG